jgi:predicted sugar kinase
MYEAAEHVLSHNDAIDQVTLDLAASTSQSGFGPTVYTYTFMRVNGGCQR